jgi:glycosyltransferase involved in cell wall biosynthesis
VVTAHDVGYRYYPEAHRYRDRWYLNWTTRRHTRVARQVIVDSQATRDDLIRFYNANPDRLSVVYLGRDEGLTPVTNAETINAVKQKYGIPPTNRYFLYLGTLHPRKNLVRLVEAFGMIASSKIDDGAPLKLVISGQKGWLFEEIFQTVQALELSEQVVFTGYVAATDKPALLSGALAFVFPSLFEGFGLPILEAMSCGAPVLTSNVSSLPEVAGKAALLVNPHDTAQIAAGLRSLATDVNLRHELVKRGFEQVKSFSWDQAASQTLAILKKASYT